MICLFKLNQFYSDIYVLGYPKSGNNFLCYSLANILDKNVILNNPQPEIFFSPNPIGAIDNRYYRNDDQKIYFNHFPHSINLKNVDQSKDYLIVILRDFHECFIRHTLQTYKGEFYMNRVFQYAHMYTDILKCYDKWNPKSRILIYYEDFLTDFESTIDTCLKKLNIDNKDTFFDKFLAEFPEHIKESKNKDRFGEILSGSDAKYHQKKWLTKETKILMNKKMNKIVPNIYHKYIQRYLQKEE